MAWQYDKSYDHLGFPMLRRQIRIKWWKKFSQSRLNLKQPSSSEKLVSSKEDKKKNLQLPQPKSKNYLVIIQTKSNNYFKNFLVKYLIHQHLKILILIISLPHHHEVYSKTTSKIKNANSPYPRIVCPL